MHRTDSIRPRNSCLGVFLDHIVIVHNVVQNDSHMCYECTVLCSRNHFQVLSNKCKIIHLIRLITHVWVCFGPYRYCAQSCAKQFPQVLWMHRFLYPKPLSSFKQQMHQIHSIRPIAHVWMCFGPFRYYAQSCAKRVPHVVWMHRFE